MNAPLCPVIAGSNDSTAKWAIRSAIALLRQVAVCPSPLLSPEPSLYATGEQLSQASV